MMTNSEISTLHLNESLSTPCLIEGAVDTNKMDSMELFSEQQRKGRKGAIRDWTAGFQILIEMECISGIVHA